MRGYGKECVFGPLFKLLEVTFELLVPLVVARIVDEGIAQGNTGEVLGLGALLVAFGAAGLASAVTAQYFAAKAAAGFAAAMRHDLFAHVQRLSFSDLDAIGASTIITRLTSDVNQIQTGVNLVLRLVLRSPFVVFGAMIMAFVVDARAALVFAVTIPVLAVVVAVIMLISIPLYRGVQNRLDRITTLTRENLAGVRVIRAFRRERAEREAFEEAADSLTRAQLFVGRISALMNPLTYAIVNIGIAVLIWSGAVRVDAGLLTQGAVIALVNYFSQILVELVKMANLVITVTKALACNRRVKQILAVEPQPSTTVSAANAPAAEKLPSAERPFIEFDHVSLTYRGAQAPALEDISLKVRRGQTIGVIGGTGSGKSSLVNLIPRFYEASQGTLSVDGTPVGAWPLAELRALTGMVPQRAMLFNGTIAENLRWGNASASSADLKQALEVAQALDFVEKLPEGLNAPIAQGGSNLSGGQRQRLTIARALVRRPRILVLDDSASALDYATDARLRRALRELDPSMTVFIVSQRTASVRFADQIVVLEDGRMAGIGTHEELLAGCPVYQEIYASQFGQDALEKSQAEARGTAPQAMAAAGAALPATGRKGA